MKSITDTLKDYEDIVKSTLKVNNPALLKTGALGTIVNIFSNLKYDAAMYYTKLIREINPGTASEFNSILLHSSILNYNITFATPSEFQISFVIPETALNVTETVTYDIPRSTKFVDLSGNYYCLEEDIQIIISDATVVGKRYSETEINDLEVSRVKNPNTTNAYMYLIDYAGLKQYQRKFQTFSVPDYATGESYSFSIDIPDGQAIYQLNAWIQKVRAGGAPLDTDTMYKLSTDKIKFYNSLTEMNIKYNKLNASQFDDNLYLKIGTNNLTFTIGDGLNGLKLDPGDQIVIETKFTKGAAGNLNSAEFNLQNIMYTSTDGGGYTSTARTNLKVLSLTGGSSGMDMEDLEYIRDQMVKKASTRSGIASLNDYEVNYTLDSGKPFVDTKFFNSKNNIFIYNIMRDDNNNIIPTCTYNIPEDTFRTELFFPTRTLNGVELVSPFYYKKSFNHYIAYMVNPQIQIELTVDANDKLLKLNNNISLFITYDYFERKTRLEIKNFNSIYTYRISTNQFNIELDIHNEFSQVINQRFLDEYCLLISPLVVNKVQILNAGSEVMTYGSTNSYFQLVRKQDHSYYSELSNIDSTIEKRHVLHLPFLAMDYLKLNKVNTVFTKLDRFFRIYEDSNLFPLNVSVSQAFYNTLSIDSKYRKYIVKTNNNGDLLTTKNMVLLKIIVDKYKYSLSNYNGLEELEFDISDLVYKTLIKAEGSKTEFYETTLEKEISNKFDMILNVDVLTPRVFSTYTSTETFQLMNDDLNTEGGLTMYDIINYVPSYFYFDYNNININITVI